MKITLNLLNTKLDKILSLLESVETKDKYWINPLNGEKVKIITINIGGKTKKQLQAEMKRQNIHIYGYTQSMLDNEDFTTLKKSEPADLVRLKVQDLNLANPTTDNIYQKAKELGLELCPAEVGPQYRL